MKKALLILTFISTQAFWQKSAAQWYGDTPKPAEIQARDQAYHILEQEINARTCNQDWDVSDHPFLFLHDHPDKQIIIRGKSVDGFSLSSWGDDCVIGLNKNSPLYKTNMEKQQVATNQLIDITKKGYAIAQAAAQNNYHLTAAQQKTADSLKPEREKANARSVHLFQEQNMASVYMGINARWMDEEKKPGFATNKVPRLTGIPGVQQEVLYIELPYDKNPDTSYSVYLYIGKWPSPAATTMVPFVFRRNTTYAWTDKEHSGPPLIENFKVVVGGHHYNNVMKVVHAIDWTKLQTLVKE